MSRKLFSFFQLVIAVFTTALFWIPVQSQDVQEPALFHVCIAPRNAEERVGLPYLLTFRNTSLVGLIISEEAADILVYSSSDFTVGTYPIVHDAATGLYRRNSESERHNSKEVLNSERLCSTNYPQTITADLFAIEPVRVTPEQVAIVEVGEGNRIETQDFLGGFAMHFLSDDLAQQKKFQIIQMDAEAAVMEMNFPFLTANTTRFALTANKPVFVRRSFVDDDTTFSAACPSDIRLIYTKVLEGEATNLFQMMEAGHFHLYPLRGLVTDYPREGFLQINLEPEKEERIPEFTAGSIIRSIINNENFDYAVSADPNLRSGELDQAEVIRVDEQGRLIVRAIGGTTDVIVMQPWLVEVVDS